MRQREIMGVASVAVLLVMRARREGREEVAQLVMFFNLTEIKWVCGWAGQEPPYLQCFPLRLICV